MSTKNKKTMKKLKNKVKKKDKRSTLVIKAIK